MEYQVGQVVQGYITGIKPYGAFVKIDESTNGLIHISEISEGYIKNINYYIRVGEKVVVKIIDIDKDDNRLKLSLKAIHSSRKNRQPNVNVVAENREEIGFRSLEEALPIWIEEATKQ